MRRYKVECKMSVMKRMLVLLLFASTLACSQTLTTNGAKHTTVGQTHVAAISSNGFVQTVLPPSWGQFHTRRNGKETQ
jgi:hypothetical protein